MRVKKILLSIAILLIAVLAYTNIINVVFIEKTFIGAVDDRAGTYLDDAMKKALITFAIVRGINAVISVIQDSEVAISPAGVGMSIAVGQILDPVNDLIERFSWVMLASSTSLGVQKILMNVGQWLGFRFLLTLAMMVMLLGLWLPERHKSKFRGWGWKLLVASVLIRFCLPLVALATSHIDSLFLDDTYQEASLTLDQASNDLQEDHTIPTAGKNPEDANLLQKIKNLFKNVGHAVNLEQRIQHLKDTLSQYTEYIIDLIVIFILKTIVIPLMMLWLLIKLGGFLLNKNLWESAQGVIRQKMSPSTSPAE